MPIRQELLGLRPEEAAAIAASALGANVEDASQPDEHSERVAKMSDHEADRVLASMGIERGMDNDLRTPQEVLLAALSGNLALAQKEDSPRPIGRIALNIVE